MLLAIRDESRRPVVPTTARHENAALQLDDDSAGQVRKIRPPTTLRVESVFAFERRSIERLPEQKELALKVRRAGFVAEADTDERHSRLSLSKREFRPSDYTSLRQPKHRIGNGIQKAGRFEFLQALAQFHEVFQARDLFLVVTAQEELPDFF